MLMNIEEKYPIWRELTIQGYKTRVAKQIAHWFGFKTFERAFNELEVIESVLDEVNVIYPRYICFLSMLDYISDKYGQKQSDELLKVVAI